MLNYIFKVWLVHLNHLNLVSYIIRILTEIQNDNGAKANLPYDIIRI